MTVFCVAIRRDSVSLKVSFSYVCPSFFRVRFNLLSLEMSIQLFSFPFLFSGSCVVCIVLDSCNSSSSALVYIVFKAQYRYINAILSNVKSSSSFLLGGYSLFTSSLVCKALCIDIRTKYITARIDQTKKLANVVYVVIETKRFFIQ